LHVALVTLRAVQQLLRLLIPETAARPVGLRLTRRTRLILTTAASSTASSTTAAALLLFLP
jgi:hypothetical protein